jgi:chemotaxis protein histidine kinase CheA/DNA-binding response OmpR family regulator
MDNTNNLNCDVTEDIEQLFTEEENANRFGNEDNHLDSDFDFVDMQSGSFADSEPDTIITGIAEDAKLDFLDSYLQEEDHSADLLIHSENSVDSTSIDFDEIQDEIQDDEFIAVRAIVDNGLEVTEVTIETPENNNFNDLSELLESEIQSTEATLDETLTIEVESTDFESGLDNLADLIDFSPSVEATDFVDFTLDGDIEASNNESLDSLLDYTDTTNDIDNLDSLLDSSSETAADNLDDLDFRSSVADTFETNNFNNDASIHNLDSLLDSASEANNIDDLDALLDSPSANGDNLGGLDELDSLLDEPSTIDNNIRGLDDLDNLLDDSIIEGEPSFAAAAFAPAVQSVAPPPANKTAKPKGFEETMRVAVKHLDNIGNLTGELVVRRNKLEENQKRMQQFLDSLLNQTQTLNDMGKRMQEVYERSLLEGAIAATRGNTSQFSNSNDNNNSSSIEARSASSEGEEDLSALELDRFTGFHSISQEIMELIVQVRESASDIQFVIDDNEQLAQNLRQVTSQIQEGITNSRMVPFGETANRLPRAVSDISFKLHKQAKLYIDERAKEVSIDKMIAEYLYNPMTHLVNNAVTHGIESPEERQQKGKNPQGSININAFLQGNQTVITVSDDGAGIDPERVVTKAIEKGLLKPAQVPNLALTDIYDFLFHPGFSTRDKADDFAGRGVGMDVVKTDLRKIRGNISIDSEVGKGTTFTIRLPLTLSICKALSCVNNNAPVAFPMDGVEGMKECAIEDIKVDEEGKSCIMWNGQLLPFQSLSNLLAINRQIGRGNIYNNSQEDDMVSIVVLRSLGSNPLAIRVDKILKEEEIVIKQIEGPVPRPAGIAGATVLGDGTVMPIGDVLELLEIAQGRRNIKISTEAWQTAEAIAQESKSEPLVLVVDDSITVRELLTLSFNKLGYQVEQARDGQEAWDKLRAGLPCDMIFCDIEMPRMNGLEFLSNLKREEKLAQVPVAMLTSRGADKHRQLAAELGATAYLTKPYTEKDLIDISQKMLGARQKVLEVHPTLTENNYAAFMAESLEVNQPSRSHRFDPTVLIVDDSITVRELLSETFKKAGYLVQQARNGQEALDKLQSGLQCDAIICDIEMPKMTGLELLTHLQKDDNLKSIPVAMLTSRGAEKHRQMAAQRGARGYLTKPYIEEVLLETTKKLMEGQILLDVPD